ncbi:MAG TPA: tetratricopeptide repeat protein, partial [Phototrophicaceae bacterium]|nr:tetratricopeptide repeat protein [Phototrophicaceae bacterium]
GCTLSSEGDYVDAGYDARIAENYEEAVALYTCALNINAKNPDSLFGRAYANNELGHYDEALADYDALLAITPDDGAALNNRGNIFYERGDYETALADYNRSIELPGHETYIPYYNRGNLYLEMGDYDQAIADLSQSIQLDPAYADAYLARAGVYAAQDNPVAFADWWEWIELIRQRTIDRTVANIQGGDTLGLEEGSVFEIPFEAEVGQIVRVAARTAAKAEVDPLVVMLGPDGQAVAGDDDSGINLDAVLRYEVTANGTYTLMVTHAGGGSDGEVTLTLNITGGTADNNVPPPPDTPADTFQVFNLIVNDLAVVYTTEGDRLNLRSGPGLDFEIVSKLQRDTRVRLLEGPRKADGYAWWRISTADGAEGWAVERVDTEQTLQLALIQGEAALVTTTAGDTLRMRSGAGTSFEVVAMIANGTVVTLLEGPQTIDGLPWWKIRTPDGIEGYAVERVGEERTLSRPSDALD